MALAFAGAAAAQPVDTGHLTAELVPQARGIAPGQTIYVALRQKIDKGWHTYWKNPGDSGEPTQIKWTLPPGFTAGDIVWPAPHKQPIGPLMNYGYSDEVVLPVPVTAPADATPGQTVTLKAAASFLVCADVCVPEDAVLQISLPVSAGPVGADPQGGRAIDKALAQAPKRAALQAAFQQRGPALQLAVTGAPLKAANFVDAYFFPYSATVIDHAKPQAIEQGTEGLTLTLAPGYDFQNGPGPSELAGVLAVGGQAYEITARQAPLPAAAAGLGPPAAAGGSGAGSSTMSLIPAVLLAFLGGLILNLMPCVFPILAMKAASLAGHAHEAAAARRQGLAFGVGVLATFLILAAVLIALQQAGQAVGWGFQLQSPAVVAGLGLLMLLVALNLSGVFEIGTSLQGAGGTLATRSGLAGAFFTGALAVVVAAPCTAPFMGPAIGWALTQTEPAALAVFTALGLGFALPFVLVAFVPAFIGRLPKPGPWMDIFKKALAFPMYGAAAWLLWVVAQQADAAFLARVLAAAILVAAAAWIGGAAQRGHAMGRRHVPQAALAAGIGAVAVAAAFWPVSAPHVEAEPYSAERLAALQSEGRPVFVNYTAAWCVSCQVNERVALSTKGTAQAFKRYNVAYLKADWTKKDDVIAADLARFGRAGVPLYLVYPGGGGDYAILPNLLTEASVVKAVEAAAKGSR
ncbi:protein-disulfide reductase DsbD family protein [Phenylobacterium sp.]|uniref:protein-disulfide reductase DsbD family protein n=1 Tax=Phenylobacterium sp. TaxID=1871053 RepID=UPI002F9220E2